ncbi:MAG: hypothetical protein FJ396_08930 [Verrucomicrobia bacterium]|nr:hypothetical protein [Verrucomicrobiota bacterium]
MKLLNQVLDKVALNLLMVGLLCMLGGLTAVGGGIWWAGAGYATAGMALMGGGAMTALVAACWIHRDH